MAKTMCKKDDYKEKTRKYTCKKCRRTAHKKERLCKPEKA